MVRQEEYSTIPKVFTVQCIKGSETTEVKSLSYYSDGEKKNFHKFPGSSLSPVMSLSYIIHDISNKKGGSFKYGVSTGYAN